ncbi:MAG: hypothetical protein V1772_11405, partial [Chloroflexota bacterium]
PLGVDGGRQRFALRYNGELFADKRLLKLKGRDAARLLWPGRLLRYCFGSGDPPAFRPGRDDTQQRWLESWLPIVVSAWRDREISYEQTAFAALLDGPLAPLDERRGDEDVVAMPRFVLRNTTAGRKRARLWIAIAPQEELALRDSLLLALGRVVPGDPVEREWRVTPYERPGLRCAVDTAGRGSLRLASLALEAGESLAVPSALLYEVDLAGGEAHAISLRVPFVTLTTPEDW